MTKLKIFLVLDKMALEIEQLIKIILGLLVVVVAGIYIFFKNQIIDFFKGLSGAAPEVIFLGLIK